MALFDDEEFFPRLEGIGFDPTGLEDVAEAPEMLGLAQTNPVLALQHMEAALARADLAHPDILSREQFRKLRYLLSFARLTVFEPGAAGPGGERGRGDVDVTEDVAEFRRTVVDALHDPLRREPDLRKRLAAAAGALEELAPALQELRLALALRYASVFSLGGLRALLRAGLTPAYMLTTSMGSIVGSVAARALPVPIDEYVEWAKTVTYRGILGPTRRTRRHGLVGLFGLHFDAFADELFRTEDGAPMRLSDLAIPFETVVSGVRKQSFDRLPARFRRSELSSLGLSAFPLLRERAGNVAAARMWQAAAFIDTRVVKPIVLGADALTKDLNVTDAASFSSSIPGVLHHETRDPDMVPLLDELLRKKDVGALVDGAAASNVPVELAWKRVQDGRLGTRNVVVYAWDCFHPQWNPKHLWLQPVTRALQIQMVRNAPFADHLVRFRPTLSVLTLAAAPGAINLADEWGEASVAPSLPVIGHLMRPVWWEGEGVPGRTPCDKPHTGHELARSMAAVLDAAREAADRATGWARVKARATEARGRRRMRRQLQEG